MILLFHKILKNEITNMIIKGYFIMGVVYEKTISS